MKQKDAYQDKLYTKLDHWESRLGQLKEQVANMKGETKLSYCKKIDNLDAKIECIKHKIEHLSQANESSWIDMRLGVEKAWDDIGDAMKKIVPKKIENITNFKN